MGKEGGKRERWHQRSQRQRRRVWAGRGRFGSGDNDLLPFLYSPWITRCVLVTLITQIGPKLAKATSNHCLRAASVPTTGCRILCRVHDPCWGAGPLLGCRILCREACGATASKHPWVVGPGSLGRWGLSCMQPGPCTLQTAPHTLHPSPCVLHPPSCTLLPVPHTLDAAPHIPLPAPSALCWHRAGMKG